MLEDLRKSLKDDLWNVIDGKDVREKTENDFLKLVFSTMIKNNKIIMDEARNISYDIKNLYNYTLENSEKMILDANGKVLEVLKRIYEGFDEELKPIERKIYRLKKVNG